MDSQQPQQPEQSQQPPNDLVGLWEQMGATTGSLIGRFIGLNAQFGLQVLESMVINPLRQNVSEPGIRSKVWTEMGRSYGESLGYSIGLAMDGLANTADHSLVEPLAEHQKTSATESATSD